MSEPVVKGLGAPMTPQIDKMLSVKAESQPQGELLEWLASEGYVICRVQPYYCSRCEEPWTDLAATEAGRIECATCGVPESYKRGGDHYVPAGRSIEQLLAQFHGIDLQELERERMRVLEYLRSLPVVAPPKDLT